MKRDVQLPDEYDEIFEDLEPFWGIDPHKLARTQQELEICDGLVIVQKTDAHPHIEAIRSTLPEHRQHLQSGIHNIPGLVPEVEHNLPPLCITFSPFENPSTMAMVLEAAANGTSASTSCRFERV